MLPNLLKIYDSIEFVPETKTKTKKKNHDIVLHFCSLTNQSDHFYFKNVRGKRPVWMRLRIMQFHKTLQGIITKG